MNTDVLADEPLGFDLDGAVYALDSTTIDLCLSVFPWARFRSQMKHTLDVRGSIPIQSGRWQRLLCCVWKAESSF